MTNIANLLMHVETLCANYLRFTGRDLVSGVDPLDVAKHLGDASFAVVSHGTHDDPIFNYGNRVALDFFEMSWEEFTSLPSRLSAEAPNQAERAGC